MLCLRKFLKQFIAIFLVTNLILWKSAIANKNVTTSPQAVSSAVNLLNTTSSSTLQATTNALPGSVGISVTTETPSPRETETDVRLVEGYGRGTRFESSKIPKSVAPITEGKADDQKKTASDRSAWKYGRGSNAQQQPQQPWAVEYSTSSEEKDSKEGKDAGADDSSTEDAGSSTTPKAPTSKDGAYIVWTVNQGAGPNAWALDNGAGRVQGWPGGANVAQWAVQQANAGGGAGLWNAPVPASNPSGKGAASWSGPDTDSADGAIAEEWPDDANNEDGDDAEWKEDSESDADDNAAPNDDNTKNNGWNPGNSGPWDSNPPGGGGWSQTNNKGPANSWNAPQGWNTRGNAGGGGGGGGGWDAGSSVWMPTGEGDNIQWKVYNENTQTMEDIDESTGWKVIGDGGADGWKVVDQDGNVEWKIENVNGEWRVTNTDEWKNDENTYDKTTTVTEGHTEVTGSSSHATTEASAKVATEATTVSEATTQRTTVTTSTTTKTKPTTETSWDDKKGGKYIVWKFTNDGKGEAKFYGTNGEPDVWTVGENAWWPSNSETGGGWDAPNGGWNVHGDGGISRGRKNGGRKPNGNDNKTPKNNNAGKTNGNGGWSNHGNKNNGGNDNKSGGNGNGNKNTKNRNGNKNNGNGNSQKYGGWSNGGRPPNGRGNASGRPKGNTNNRPKGNVWPGKNSNPGRSGKKPSSSNQPKKNGSNGTTPGSKNGGGNKGWQPKQQGWSAPINPTQNTGKPSSNGWPQNGQGTPYIIIIQSPEASGKSGGHGNPWAGPTRRRGKSNSKPRSNRRSSSRSGWQWDPNSGTAGGLQWMESWINAQTDGLITDKNTYYTRWRPTTSNAPKHSNKGSSNKGRPAKINPWSQSVSSTTTSAPTVITTNSSIKKPKPANSKGKQIIIIDYTAKGSPKGDGQMKKDIEHVLKTLKSAKPTGIKGTAKW